MTKSSKGKVISQMGVCECGKLFESHGSSEARRMALSHYRETGHSITGQSVTRWEY